MDAAMLQSLGRQLAVFVQQVLCLQSGTVRGWGRRGTLSHNPSPTPSLLPLTIHRLPPRHIRVGGHTGTVLVSRLVLLRLVGPRRLGVLHLAGVVLGVSLLQRVHGRVSGWKIRVEFSVSTLFHRSAAAAVVACGQYHLHLSRPRRHRRAFALEIMLRCVYSWSVDYIARTVRTAAGSSIIAYAKLWCSHRGTPTS